ncbi:MAG: hypothetical protein IH840_11155, partial [Candidatus Heimdallarchaeota archaeon]|nr:hypothetical protein [Candidatus Heimdallarchaeota archaeon]
SKKNIVSAFVVNESRGKPNPPTPISDIDLEPIDFISIREQWNVYKLADGTNLRVRAIATQITVSETRNQFGEPIYVINNSLSLDYRPPKHLRKKRKKRRK